MSLVLTSIADRVATITLNRADKRNALNAEMINGLIQTLTDLEQNDEVKVVVITGAGSTFCAGADLAYLQQLQKNSFAENLEDSLELKKLFYTIYNFDKIVIAKINGHAIAGGCGLATVCDFAYTTKSAKFGYTEVKIGFIPAVVMPFLVRKVGELKAKELLFTGKIINAQEAVNYGFVNAAVDADELDDTVNTLANTLCEQTSSHSLKVTKQLFNSLDSFSIESSLIQAAKMNAEARSSDDCQKGISAFLNKEKIKW